ncbi:MAG: hypothetical protein H7A36_04765 [Chlamydiales bacterium]|nr:hypothetical protein [Chlamydiales bacterium]
MAALIPLFQKQDVDGALLYLEQHGHNVVDVVGRTCIHLAVLYLQDPQDFYERVLEKTGEITWQNVEGHLFNRHDKTDLEATALTAAAIWNKTAHIEALIKCGASSVRSDVFGRFPLHYAAMHRSPDSIALLDMGHKPMMEAEDRFGRSPKYYASEASDSEVEQRLLLLGCKIESVYPGKEGNSKSQLLILTGVITIIAGMIITTILYTQLSSAKMRAFSALYVSGALGSVLIALGVIAARKC